MQGVRGNSEQTLWGVQVHACTMFDRRTGLRNATLVASHTISAATLSLCTGPEIGRRATINPGNVAARYANTPLHIGAGKVPGLTGASFPASGASRSGLHVDSASTNIMKILVRAVIALVLWIGGAAPAIAEPDSGETGPNPFGGLDCSCQETCPAGSTEQRNEIDRGIMDGLCAWSSGLSAGQPNQPRP